MDAYACHDGVTWVDGDFYYTHDPVTLMGDVEVSHTSIDAQGNGRFTLVMETRGPPLRLLCLVNRSMDFFCTSDERSKVLTWPSGSTYRKEWPRDTRPDARRPALAPVSQPPRSDYWHYIYGWILDPDDREVLFGVLMTATNHEGYWPCPDRTVWTAEWVGEAE